MVISISDRERQVYDTAYLQNLKKKKMMKVDLFTKQERLTDLKEQTMATKKQEKTLHMDISRWSTTKSD